MSTQHIQQRKRVLRRRYRTAAARRRGVLLLVILSILIMFLMTAVAFVLVAQQYNKASKAISKSDVVTTDPADLLDAALYDLLRDTNNPYSRLRYHSLLRDLYGNDHLTGAIASATWIGGDQRQDATGGQMIQVVVRIDESLIAKVSTVVGYYNGCLLTLEDGPARGQSLRIVHSKFDGTKFLELRIMAPKNDQVASAIIWPEPEDRVVINGRPFNGTGVGYNPNNGKCDAVDGLFGPYALMPNPVFFEVSANTTPYYGDRTGTVLPALWEYPGIGGSDESYDTADFQNMFLALSSELPDLPAMPMTIDLGAQFVLPSFHRPALINYWMNKTGLLNDVWNNENFADANPSEASLARKVILRPLPTDHPNFPKLNHLIAGPWDVDNDNDGVPDSVWVDLGAPVIEGKDGRFYKPMYAILCQDLDGRLNLNAHGSREDVVQGRPGVEQDAYLANAIATNRPPGQGYGPAEITLRGVLQVAEYAKLLVGNGSGILGRYGIDQMPGWDGVFGGNGNIWDIRAQIRFFQYPIFNTWNTIRRGFMTPPDLKGQFGLGLDFQGFPNFRQFKDRVDPTNYNSNEIAAAESPYEMDLLSDGAARTSPMAADMPFTVAELERVLRAYDADMATLPSRLQDLAPGTFFAPNSSVAARNRRLVTTRSIDLPVPSIALTEDIREHIVALGSKLDNIPLAVKNKLLAGSELTVGDLLLVRILEEIDPSSPPGGGTFDEFLTREIPKLLAIDLIDGLRMNVNRPFGDGRDNDGDNAVDEPGELNYAPWLRPEVVANVDSGTTQTIYQDMTMDVSHGILNPAIVGDVARQLYARNLYVLAMTLVDKEYEFPTEETVNAQEFKAQRLAQWAVNVADFRDPDAVMTGFEYDVNPFNGWDVDGDLSTTNDHAEWGVVWGCEKPQLLLTETLAFHNLRVVDSKNDIGSGKKHWQKSDNDKDPDKDLDQYRVPQGSAFFELYCTGNPYSRVMPGELYSYQGNDTTGAWYLDLGRASLGPQKDPVWRLAISTIHRDPDDSVRNKFRAEPETTTFQPGLDSIPIDRYVTFTSNAPTSGAMLERTFWNRNGPRALVPPGHYAVVGPRLETVISSMERGMERLPAKHAIRLNPTRQPDLFAPDSNAHQLEFVFVDHGAVNHPYGHDPIWFGRRVKPPIAIVAAMNPPSLWNRINTPVGVNISEPLPTSPNYYDEPTVHLTGYPDTDAYGDLVDPTKKLPNTVMDLVNGRPIDDLANNANPVGLYRNTRTVYLQRLANPTEDWNSVSNPYVTVDWLPIDLTVYNGEDRQSTRIPGVAGEISNKFPGWCEENRYQFASRERGRENQGGRADNIWRSETEDQLANSAASHLESFFRHNLVHTLGYLNHVFGEPIDMMQVPFAAGYTSTTPLARQEWNYARYQAMGSPQKPFPWLTWNDRPFVSPLELALVPFSAPGRLTVEHTTADDSLDTYDPNDESDEPDHRINRNATFGHLLNFFCTSDRTAHTGTAAPHLYRLFDYLGSPTRFVGGETYLNPNQFGSGAGTYADGTQFRRPPYNRISEYREPGRVNLNTIVSERVYDALLYKDSSIPIERRHPGPEANVAAWSRRGYGAGTDSIFKLDNNYPTFFANPYRSADSGKLVPLPNMEQEGIDCSLLRRNPSSNSSDEPLFKDDSNALYNDTDRNPYFRYQPSQRLANLVTTRSNVYAIWITVGLFEVEPVPDAIKARYNMGIPEEKARYDRLYPDGYMLGRELGADTGDIERHRAFYIIDRSVPVGFEPGKNLNVDRAILLRRHIE